MSVKTFLLLLFITLALAPFTVQAQGNGQFCVRAFEDRNANGERDANEPLLTRGIGANLRDEAGLIIASALLDNSPTGARGVICFQQLPAGQYTMDITSAEYRATGMENMTVVITRDSLPTIFDYGGERIYVAQPEEDDADSVDTDVAIERLLVAAGGAVIAMVVMVFIGLLIYMILLRRRRPKAEPVTPDEYYRPPSESLPEFPYDPNRSSQS